jgi:hypothetical protein
VEGGGCILIKAVDRPPAVEYKVEYEEKEMADNRSRELSRGLREGGMGSKPTAPRVEGI